MLSIIKTFEEIHSQNCIVRKEACQRSYCQGFKSGLELVQMNWNMLGHEWAVTLLSGHLAKDRLRQAYLFTGPRGIGRRTLALRFAQAINCPNRTPNGEPCQNCRTCSQIERLSHPDVTIINPEEPGAQIKVDQIRELQRAIALAPYQAAYRVAIIPSFENTTTAGMNALLKTLEEPPSQVVLVLTAESGEALLPTIVSRCERLLLRPLSLAAVESGLIHRWQIVAETAGLLAHISGGRPGIAMAFHENEYLMTQREDWLDSIL